ncbi:MAG: hypothetical protein WCF99_01480 [Chloroflexales bacterium]
MPESITNGAGAGLQLRDWLAEPEAPAEQLPAGEPNRPQPQPRPSAPATAITERQRRAAVSDAALVVPDLVRLQLDTALFGDHAPHGSAGPDGAPRSKNLTVLVGTVRVRTNRRGQTQCVITDLGAVQYRYELSINEVFASETGVAYETYRFPITMHDAVLARCGDLLVDGQRVAVLGPIALDVTYDSRFQTDAYDAGLRTWTVQMDVLDVRAVGDDVPDMAWVQLEGEVIDQPRIFAHRYGDRREMIDRYAGISLRCRELLAGPRGAAARAVTRVVPIEVLIDPYEELIAASDALLRIGNLVRIEGRFSPSTYQIRPPRRQDSGETKPDQRPDEIAQALERTRASIMARNAELHTQAERHQQAVQATQERNRSRAAEGKQALPLPNAPARPLPDQVLEQRIIQAQRRLLTGTRIRVEVGYVELLRGTPITADERAQLIADREAEERTRASRRQRSDSRRPRAQPELDVREATLDQATEQLMLRVAEADDGLGASGLLDEPDAATPPAPRAPGRPAGGLPMSRRLRMGCPATMRRASRSG